MAGKRGGGEYALALDELEDCVASSSDVEKEVEQRELVKELNEFLSKLHEQERDIFICRYFFLLSLSEICNRFGYSPSKVKSMLSRTRKKLYAYLEKEGLL